MTEKPETCPTCNRYTTTGHQQLAVEFRSRPIYGTDMTKPLSELIADIRSQIVKSRGQLNDISMGFTGWLDRLQSVEGLLTCGLIALHRTMEEMQEHERKYPEAHPHGIAPSPIYPGEQQWLKTFKVASIVRRDSRSKQ